MMKFKIVKKSEIPISRQGESVKIISEAIEAAMKLSNTESLASEYETTNRVLYAAKICGRKIKEMKQEKVLDCHTRKLTLYLYKKDAQ